MPFNKPLPEWKNPGVKPNQGLIDAGWKPDDKPPADVHNWWMNTSYVALEQLQNEAINKDQIGVANGVAPLGDDGKVPASMVSGNTAEIETQLENHINNDLGHVRFLGGSSGQNAMTVTATMDIPVVNDTVPNPVPKTGVAFRFFKITTNSGAVQLQINYNNGKSSLSYPVVDGQSKALTSGALVNGGMYTVAFNGTSFFLQGSGSGVNIGTRGTQIFNTVGDTAFTVPDGVTRIHAQLWGAGGGGGGANSANSKGGGGGGSGAFKEYLLRVTPGSQLTIRIGKGGDGGTYTSSSTNQGSNGVMGMPTEIIGAASGNVAAFGGGGGTGATNVSGGGGGGGAHLGTGFTGSLNPPAFVPLNGVVYRLSNLTGEQFSPLLKSIGGSSGSYGSSYQGGGGGAAPSDTMYGNGGSHASPGSASSIFFYQNGGAGGSGASVDPAGLTGGYPGGGGAGGNSYSSAVYNGGKGGDGLVILAW